MSAQGGNPWSLREHAEIVGRNRSHARSMAKNLVKRTLKTGSRVAVFGIKLTDT